MGDDNGSDGAVRDRLLGDLGRVYANLARLRIPPLLDPDIARRLDDDDLAIVVKAERHNLARVASAVEEAYGYSTRRRG